MLLKYNIVSFLLSVGPTLNELTPSYQLVNGYCDLVCTWMSNKHPQTLSTKRKYTNQRVLEQIVKNCTKLGNENSAPAQSAASLSPPHTAMEQSIALFAVITRYGTKRTRQTLFDQGRCFTVSVLFLWGQFMVIFVYHAIFSESFVPSSKSWPSG